MILPFPKFIFHRIYPRLPYAFLLGYPHQKITGDTKSMNLIQRTRCLMAAVLFSLAAPAVADTVTASFTSASTIPVTADSYIAGGNDVALALSFTPPVGSMGTQ